MLGSVVDRGQKWRHLLCYGRYVNDAAWIARRDWRTRTRVFWIHKVGHGELSGANRVSKIDVQGRVA